LIILVQNNNNIEAEEQPTSIQNLLVLVTAK